jgi:hypothetical protein
MSHALPNHCQKKQAKVSGMIFIRGLSKKRASTLLNPGFKLFGKSIFNSPYALFADHFRPSPANLSRSFFMNSFGYSIQKELKIFFGYFRNEIRKKRIM